MNSTTLLDKFNTLPLKNAKDTYHILHQRSEGNAYDALQNFLNRNNLEIVIVDKDNHKKYEDFILEVEICDKKYLKNDYEMLAYSVLEDDKFVGFFLVDKDDNKKCYVSLIIDIECSSTPHKLEHCNIDVTTFKLENFVELAMICSNYKHKIKGAANMLLLAVIEAYKQEKKNIILWLANPEINYIAKKFYLDMGFLLIPKTTSGYVLLLKNVKTSKSGGSQTKHKYKNKLYTVQTGSRGGKYIVSNKQKIYVK